MDKNAVCRSGLIMPIVTRRFVEKAWQRGCDCITLDLEDSVPQHLKQRARDLVKESIPDVARGGAYVFVRINRESVLEDLEKSVWPGLSRVRYPKAETAAEVRDLDGMITRLERERGMEPGSVEIVAHIETAKGISAAREIASASPRIREFGGGGGYDMSRDLGMEMFVEFDQFIYGKGEVELTARALGQAIVRTGPFIPNTTGNVSDGDRALREAVASFRCGFLTSGGGLNPGVVDAHNKGYTPSAEDVADARWVLEKASGLDGAEATWLEVEGRIIDRYEVERARAMLDWAERCAARDREKELAMAQAGKEPAKTPAN